ncbi:ATP-binding cassette domain-containing protein [Sphingomonas baiyangensis]|nr:ABC transporter ATP-binding protein [Sphingomonas baiyangensis]
MTLMLLGAILEGVGLAMLVPLVAVLADAEGRASGTIASLLAQVGISSPFGQLAGLLGFFVVIILLRAIVLMARERALARLQIEFIEHERLCIITAVARADWSQLSGLRHARVVNALTVNIQRVGGTVQLLMQIVVSLLMFAAQLIVVLALVPGVGIAILVFTLIGAARLWFGIQRGLRQGVKIGRAQLGLTETTERLLNGLKVATAENAQMAFVQVLADTSTEMSAGQIAYQRELSRFRATVSAGIGLAGAAMLLVGFWTQGGTPTLLAALLIISRMAGPALGIYQNVEVFATLLPAHTEIRQLEQELRTMQVRAHDGAVDLRGTVRLDKATYLHADGGGIHDVTLTIEPGEIVAITGASGSGKTTLIDLLASLLCPQSGSMHVNDLPLDGALAPCWREHIAYVGQDAFLMNDTIRTNLTWGCRLQDDASLWRALEQVEIAQTVRAMPMGLDTMLNEHGARLSGGERQRIALARALMRRPFMLILDEASNAIDIETENKIMMRLAAVRPRPIILIVAHRTETLRACTRQISVMGGRVIEDRVRLPDGLCCQPIRVKEV